MNIPDIPDEWKYLLGAIVGGIIGCFSSILTSIINQNSQTKRERQKWQAEKLLEYYQYSINELFNLERLLRDMNSQIIEGKNNEEQVYSETITIDPQIKKIYKELLEKCNNLQTYLNLITSTQKIENSEFNKEVEEFNKKVTVYILGQQGLKLDLQKEIFVKEIRESLIILMKKDKRINQMFTD